jgi:hypothetical protein
MNSEIEKSPSDAPKENALQKLIGGGADVAGGAIGGALGFLAGGPEMAAVMGGAGALVASTLKTIGEEASSRLLGQRERIRVGGVLAMAAAEIRTRLENGEAIRDDGFFSRSASNRSDGEEVAESVLLKGQREPEERKLPYMAHILSNIAFNSEISPSLAHQVIKAAEQLTYRQLCLLRLAVVKSTIELRAGDYRGQGSLGRELYQVLYECLDLYVRGLVNFGGEVAFGPTDVKPRSITIQGLGADLYNLMELWNIPDSDLTPLQRVLSS